MNDRPEYEDTEWRTSAPRPLRKHDDDLPAWLAMPGLLILGIIIGTMLYACIFL